jgi:hypothetical protein
MSSSFLLDLSFVALVRLWCGLALVYEIDQWMEVVGMAWICLLYALICCLGPHSLKWSVGVVFISPNPHIVVGQKASTFCRRAHKTVRCTQDTVRCLPRQSTVGVYSSRPLGFVAVDRWVRSLPRQSGAVATSADRWGLRQSTVGSNRCQTIRCHSPRASVVGLFAQTIRLSHQTVRCAPDNYYSMSGAPPGAGWLPFSWISLLILLGFFCSWVLDFSASFYVFFWGVASSLP